MLFSASGFDAASRPTRVGDYVLVGDGAGFIRGIEQDDAGHIVGVKAPLEALIFPPGKDAAVTNAKVKIVVTDLATKKAQQIATAKMYGIKEGPSDTHYGNNVDLPAGSYSVEITVNGEKADFTVAIPTS